MELNDHEKDALIACIEGYTRTIQQQIADLKRTKHPNKEIIRNLEKRKNILEAIKQKIDV